VTEVRPRGAWVHTGKSRVTSPKLHLVRGAAAAWKAGKAFIAARTECGIFIAEPRFPIYPPGHTDLCDNCVLQDYVMPPVVYRMFDTTGRLLYIGCTVNLLARVSAHAASKAGSYWFPLVARCESVEYPTHREALTAETFAIFDERPLFNHQGVHVAHNLGRRGRKELAARLMAEAGIS